MIEISFFISLFFICEILRIFSSFAVPMSDTSFFEFLTSFFHLMLEVFLCHHVFPKIHRCYFFPYMPHECVNMQQLWHFLGVLARWLPFHLPRLQLNNYSRHLRSYFFTKNAVEQNSLFTLIELSL